MACNFAQMYPRGTWILRSEVSAYTGIAYMDVGNMYKTYGSSAMHMYRTYGSRATQGAVVEEQLPR